MISLLQGEKFYNLRDERIHNTNDTIMEGMQNPDVKKNITRIITQSNKTEKLAEQLLKDMSGSSSCPKSCDRSYGDCHDGSDRAQITMSTSGGKGVNYIIIPTGNIYDGHKEFSIIYGGTINKLLAAAKDNGSKKSIYPYLYVTKSGTNTTKMNFEYKTYDEVLGAPPTTPGYAFIFIKVANQPNKYYIRNNILEKWSYLARESHGKSSNTTDDISGAALLDISGLDSTYTSKCPNPTWYSSIDKDANCSDCGKTEGFVSNNGETSSTPAPFTRDTSLQLYFWFAISVWITICMLNSIGEGTSLFSKVSNLNTPYKKTVVLTLCSVFILLSTTIFR